MKGIFGTVAVSLLLGGALGAAPGVRAAERVLFVLDGSGSMWGEVDGRPKIAIAKEVLGGMAASLPESLEAGLLVYGHRRKGSCADIELVVNEGADRETLLARLGRIDPKGKTPIAGSLERAGEHLRASEDAATVVLVSDGIESCGGDPCAVAARLREQGLDVVVHSVGFDVDDTARDQLVCIAEAGGGDYHNAGDTAALGEALASVRAAIAEPAPEPLVIAVPVASVTVGDDVLGVLRLMRDGEQVFGLSKGAERQVPPGRYTARFDSFESDEFEITAGERRTITAAEFGTATVTVGDDVLGVLRLMRDGEQVFGLSKGVERQVPPGRYTARFKSFESDEFEIAAGERRTITAAEFGTATVTVGDDVLGVLRLMRDGEQVFGLSKGAERQVPPGRYTARFDSFESDEFEIAADERRTITAAEFDLATVTVGDDIEGTVRFMQDGEQIASASRRATRQLAPGTYDLRFQTFTVGGVELKPNETRVIELQ